MKELIVATRNRKKLKEIRELLSDLPVKVTSLADYADMPFIEEDGKTFAANAIKKAVTIAMYTGKPVMGEDSGLRVKALHNRPGVHSARYAGENATDKTNNRKLLRELKNVPPAKRQARYFCYVALADKNRIVDVVSGTCGGRISERARGSNGFGYDPVFFVLRYGKTFGELDPAIKAQISHRARALKKFKRVFQQYLRKEKM